MAGQREGSGRYLFEKYLIINIDNIQRKYAIRSRYGINKNLTTGPDLQNIIKSDNDKGCRESHLIFLSQYFANKIHRVDHIILALLHFRSVIFFYSFIVNFLRARFSPRQRDVDRLHTHMRGEIRNGLQGASTGVPPCGFHLIILYFSLQLRERSEKTGGDQLQFPQ